MINKNDKLFEIWENCKKFFVKKIIMKKLKVIQQIKKVLNNNIQICQTTAEMNYTINK